VSCQRPASVEGRRAGEGNQVHAAATAASHSAVASVRKVRGADREIRRAYNDDFALMLMVVLASLPLLLLIRGPRRQPVAAAADD